MASSIRQLHHCLFRLSRRYCCGASAVSPPEPEGPMFSQIRDGLCPSVVALHTHFSGGGAPDSASIGTGVFVDTRLIVTTASTVGRLSTFYDSGSRSVLHNCLISRTIALTEEGKSLRTTPVAVNFSGDLAVLEVAEVEGNLPPPCTVANVFEENETAVITLARREDFTEILYVPRLRKTVRPKSPWPLEEELGWVDYGVSSKYLGSKNFEVKIANFTGSPWFNERKEIVGYASWAAADADGDVKSYAVPASRIRFMIDYAKSKGPHDPIVMDRWIKDYAISDDNPAIIIKEGLPAWYTYVVMHIGRQSLIGRWTGESFRNVLEY